MPHEDPSNSPTPITGQGLVTTPQAEAAYEGARVLDDGGNAADALVTSVFVQGIVDPHRCGIGGFGCATLVCAENGKTEPLCIDFHGRAGSLAREDVWLDRFEGDTPDGFGFLVRDKLNDVGYQSITVPGMLAGLAAIHERFGSMPWRDLVERSVPYAESGFRVTPELAEFWIRPGLFGRVSTGERLGFTETGKRISFKADGSTYKAGEKFRQPELARTYRRLAEEGAESFYRGKIAREIGEDWERGGALVTRDDLAAYEPQIRAPLRGSYGGLEVLTTPLPGGGVALLQTLALLDRSAPRIVTSPADIDFIHRMAGVLQTVWRDRLEHQGDPAFGTPPDADFLSGEYLDRLDVSCDEMLQSGADCPDTTQVTIVDSSGNAISFSHSLGYNSGVFHPDLGILFNNCMSAFDPRPGHANSIAPGKARSTAVAETIILEDGKVRLVLGSPGASRITAGLAEVIVNVVDFDMHIAEAVIHPRFDGYGPGTLLLESRFPLPVVDALAARGWKIVQSPKPFGVVGRVYAAEITGRSPLRVDAGVDPGAPGAVFRGGGKRKRPSDA
jgi:gamma-glutamyltranspeptidase/glutathione hydrolase